MVLPFPENARWNAERQAMGFGVKIGRMPRCGPLRLHFWASRLRASATEKAHVVR
jgi:hypothetical protein